jgi:hypothetical protein
MKKAVSFLLFILIVSKSIACDICGCGVGNFNPYLFPHLSKNFFSISWQHRYYHTHFIENGEQMNNREYYNTLSLTGQYSPTRNLQLMVMLPFQVNKQAGTEGTKSLSRPGDLFFLANYKILDHVSKGGLRQAIMLGAGAKFATGTHQFEESDDGQVGNSNFQAGTGSTDALINAYYSLRYKQYAFSTGMNYKMNGTNKDGYRFGNRFQTTTQIKYIKDLGKASVVPSIGLITECMKEDIQSGVKVEDKRTGGTNTQGLLGLDINSRKIAVGLNYSFSISQNLANGRIQSKPGFGVHVSYSL